MCRYARVYSTSNISHFTNFCFIAAKQTFCLKLFFPQCIQTHISVTHQTREIQRDRSTHMNVNNIHRHCESIFTNWNICLKEDNGINGCIYMWIFRKNTLITLHFTLFTEILLFILNSIHQMAFRRAARNLIHFDSISFFFALFLLFTHE